MKKTGFTLTEIIVSIALISVIMIFLINLLIQVNYEKVNELYNSANAVNRAEIIKKVEKDLSNNVNKINIKYGDDLIVEFTDNESKISKLNFFKQDKKYYVVYIDKNSNKTKWQFKSNSIDTIIDLKNYKIEEIYPITGNSELYSAVTLSIPVIIENEYRNSSVLDDFVFSFFNYGKRIEVKY